MPAEASLKEGNLRESLGQLEERVRSDPSDVKQRIFLFQLLAVLGEWDRAMTQLGVIGDMDAGALAMVQTYREAIRCEILRAEIFSGRRSPVVFGEPEEWLALLMEALRLAAGGKQAQSQPLREKAFEAAPATSGAIDGQTFEWIADGDTRLGPVLEAIVNGRYYWIPFRRIKEVRLEPPADLRDVVWMPARFTWSNGGETVGLIPARYAGSERSEDGRIRLARVTEWIREDGDVYVGLGQRMLTTDAGEHPLMDVRAITFNTAGEAQAAT